MTLPIRSHADTPKNRSTRSTDGKNASSGLIACGSCKAVWTGLRACHCSGCHETFTGLSAFDTHRVGGQCNKPESLITDDGEPRLVRADKLHWSGWGTPGDGSRWWE